MAITLYYMPHSPACRSVMMLAKRIGVKLDLKHINIIFKEQLEPFFVKINPQHTVPTIDDNGFVLWESRAIMSYMVSKYAKIDSLYPQDLQLRAIVDQRLFYDIDILYKNIVLYFSPVLLGEANQPLEKYYPVLDNAFKLLNQFLQNGTYVAGNNVTIADYAIIANVCTIMEFGFDISKYEKVTEWYEHCKKIMEKDGFKEFNEDQAKIIGLFYLANLKN